MNERVRRLREASVSTRPSITSERAEIVTECMQAMDQTLSPPMQRALIFRRLMEKKQVAIGEGELIVGERGPGPKITPTFPEICCHTVEELDILSSRKKVSYDVDENTRKAYRERIIPFWEGKTMREKVFAVMTPEWMEAYKAGVFTEFMEQRAPGHTALDGKVYQKGMCELKAEIEDRIRNLDYLSDLSAFDQKEELEAMAVCCDALVAHARRYADLARRLSKKELDLKRKSELRRMAEICDHVPAHAPRNIWEAIQAYWFVHVGVITELNTWDAISPGRLDQHLAPFYRKDLEAGAFTRDEVKELLQCLFIKFNNQPAPPKVGVTAQESGTYNDFALISLGGVKTDGSDGVTDLSYLVLEVLQEMQLVQPHVCIQLSQKNPDLLVKKAAEVNRTGLGQPSVFNHDAVVQELVRQGKSIEDARDGGTSGCVETGALGKENYTLTGYFNLPKVLEITLHNGKDPRTGKSIGLKTGTAGRLKTFDALFDAFEKQVRYFVDIKVRGNHAIERLYARYMPTPFLSLLISDCIQKGMDYHCGGARYNTTYIQGVGLGSITDMFSSIRYHVYDQKTITLEALLGVLDADFKGYEKERQRFLNKTPKYGNDDEYADALMKRVFEAYFGAVDNRPNTKGGRYHINLLPTTVHVYFGSVMGASADGRRAGEPLSEGVSPVQGADRNGPTAVIRSVGKIDHLRTGGTLLNQKFTPQLLADQKGIDTLSHLIRSYFRMSGHHIQFNVVTKETLRDAQRHPEKHRDLIVRVAGYSDYFCNLSEPLQEEIIARTEHSEY